jgi:SAM-dependent methyltransferase
VSSERVVWHDVECGSYAEDLPLWRSLAGAVAPGPVLDLGAGTGRVALDLAARGIAVWALDRDAELLAALRERAGARPVRTVLADARAFALGPDAPAFALALAPMQTVQLLGGPAGRAGMLRSVRAVLRPGALLACALAHLLEGYDADDFEVAHPDRREVGGVVYASRPTAVRDRGDGFVLERVRERVAADGSRTVSDDAIRLDRVRAEVLEGEGRAAGFTVEPRLWVPETEDHVGSEVVVLRAA